MEKRQIQRKKILFLNNFLFGSYLLQTISFMGLTKVPIFQQFTRPVSETGTVVGEEIRTLKNNLKWEKIDKSQSINSGFICLSSYCGLFSIVSGRKGGKGSLVQFWFIVYTTYRKLQWNSCSSSVLAVTRKSLWGCGSLLRCVHMWCVCTSQTHHLILCVTTIWYYIINTKYCYYY